MKMQHKASVSPSLGTPLPLSLAITAALAVSNPLSAANFNVTQAIDNGDDSVNGSLSWAIRQANVAAGDDTITLTTDVTIQNVMTNLINSNVEIEGNSHTVSGNSQFRPFFVLSGTVTLRNLTVSDGHANGGYGSGGGAGLGGALFVYDGSVTVENVAFSNNAAVGGDGGNAGGGGGMAGNSSNAGGGLFAASTGNDGGYGGNGNYGGSGGNNGGGSGGFGRRWRLRQCCPPDSAQGGRGGFGGGGGFAFWDGNELDGGAAYGGHGGFGGGGGRALGDWSLGGHGGFGGGGGGSSREYGGHSGFGGGNGSYSGGGAAGFGGALFAKKGTVMLNNVVFNNNSASNGLGGLWGAEDGEGRGGAIFICTAEEGGSGCSAVINDCGNNSFSGNTATTGENDIFGTLNSVYCEPTLVTLTDFQVNSGSNGIELSWRTATELDNAGFNVWRRVSGGFWEKVNESLIPAQGDNSSYSFVDSSSAGQDFEYRLEDIDLFDNSTFHYPAGTAPIITLKSPADGAVFGSSNVPVFKWEATGYEGFSFQYAYPGSGIESLPWSSLMEFSPAADSWASFAQQLDGETVFWRIKGKFGENEENYSDVWQLSVEE